MRNLKLKDFEKLEFIGRGSFGRVYLVRHIRSDKFFAMKVLRKADIYKANETRHVLNERNILRDLNSSFVVSFVGSFQDETCLYLVMEYIIGGELFTQLTLKKRFPNDQARFYAAETLLFFEDIHSQNIVYRDLKPENILIDAMGHLKIVDFGFAKNLNKRTRTFCGTPQYMAPEVILSADTADKEQRGYNHMVDYYSLGVLIYEMLVGYTPFQDLNVSAIYRRVLYGHVEFPWGIDACAKDLIKALLTRDPMKRLGANCIDDIKNHKWFKGIDWDQLRRREVNAPFVPKFSHAGDTCNYIAWGLDKEDTEEAFDFGDVFCDF
jgi:serine/threonine protein kinase